MFKACRWSLPWFLTSDDQAQQSKIIRLSSLLLFALVVFVLGVAAEYVNPWLAFDRALLEQGQYWRLITCHLVHLSSNHMLMNLSAFALASLALAESAKTRHWFLCLVFSSIVVGLGILLFDTNTVGYVGLSGALYGQIIFGALIHFKHQPLLSLLAYAVVTYRVIAQVFLGSTDLSATESFIGGRVITSAHFYGLVAGNLFAAVYLFLRGRRGRAEDGAKF